MKKMRDGLRIAAMTAGLLAVMPAAVSQAQMSLPGSLEVSDTGAATYTIPIAVPPGTAGMQPSLSLVYNSQGGNGMLGVGWSLSGLPAVTRCPKTIVQDGTAGGVNYDANDRFCLEGQRLIAVSGSYGADQTEYRTEREGFSKIVSYGTAGSGPASFKVWTKSGQVMEFGSTGDSQIEAESRPSIRIWAISKISDTKGNYIAVAYAEDNANGEYHPARIDYTGNTAAGASPFASVRFVYTSRPDPLLLYQAGSRIRANTILTNIQTYVGESLVGDYRFTYALGNQTIRTRLTGVSLCAADNTCLPSTTFNWQGASSPPGTLINTSAWGAYNFITGDFNGDGRTDVLLQAKNAGQDSYLLIADEAGNMAFTFTGSGWDATLYKMHAGDWNGDGKTDLLLVSTATGGTSYFFLSNGTAFYGWGYNPPWGGLGVIVGDWDGDGRSDVLLVREQAGAPADMHVSNGSQMVWTGYSPPWGGLDLVTGDWNADGRTDILLVSRNVGGLAYFHLSNGVQFYATGYNPGWGGSVVVPGDWNGDGATDVYLVGTGYASPAYLHLSPGTGAGMIYSGYGPAWGGIFYIVPGDWNGDGRADVALMRTVPGNSHFQLTTTTGESTFDFGYNPFAVGGWALVTGDWNGDGLTDLWFVDPVGLGTQQYVSSHTPEAIASITSGIGGILAFTYKPLTKAAVYTKASGGAYPQIDIQAPIYVVSEVYTSDGIGGNYRSTYKYAGARAHAQGRGFLGFESMTAKDEQTLVEQVTTYLQAHPYTGLMASRVKKLGATTLNETVNTYGSNDLGSGRSFVFLQQSVEKSWELNGSLVSQVTTAHQYDAYGNAMQVVVSTPDGYSKTTANTYTNDTLNWLLGRLTRASVTSVTPN